MQNPWIVIKGWFIPVNLFNLGVHGQRCSLLFLIRVFDIIWFLKENFRTQKHNLNSILPSLIQMAKLAIGLLSMGIMIGDFYWKVYYQTCNLRGRKTRRCQIDDIYMSCLSFTRAPALKFLNTLACIPVI